MGLVLCTSLSAAQDIAPQAQPSADNLYTQKEAVSRPITAQDLARANALRQGQKPSYGFQTSSGHGLFTSAHTLALASGQFRPQPGVEPQIQTLAKRQGYAHAWVQPTDGIQDGFLSSLHSLGIETFASLSGAVQAKIPVAALQALASREDIRWVGTAPPRAKLHPVLAAQLAEDETQKRFPIWVSLMGDSANGGLSQRMKGAGLTVTEYRKRTRTFAVDASAKEILALSALNEVHFLSARAAFKPLNGTGSAMSGNANIWADYQMGLLSSQTPTGVIDSGFAFHTDLTIERLNFANGGLDATQDAFGHGTQVLGAMLGRGFVNLDARGGNPFLANLIVGRVWLARYFDDAGNPVGDINDLYAALATTQAGSEIPKVINCSWGSPSIGGAAYSGTEQECLDIDHVAYNTNQLYVFAAGNDGLNGASTVGIPGAAANVLTVGNTKPYEMVQGDNTLGEIALTSSQGPTADGRLKPEITAPGGGDPGDAGSGCLTTSANDPATYETAPGGTSMSTPQVTALAASLIDRYPYFSFNPPALRAALMATAMHPEAGAQNDDYGFGMMDAYRAHHDSLSWQGAHIPLISVKQGAGGNMATTDIDIPVGTVRLTIAMAWHEPALSTVGGATPVTGHIDLGVDYGIDGWTDASATGNANYQYLVLENPTPGPARLIFFPRDTDLNDNGTPSTLVAGAAYLFESELNPTIAATTSLSHEALKKEEWASITTVLSTDMGLASLTIANLMDWSADLPIQSVQYTLQDGSDRYVGFPLASSTLVLGSLIEAKPRSITWTFRAADEGEFQVNMKVNSDNAGSVTDSYTLWVDSTPPNLVSNLSSATHPIDVWVASRDVEITWDTALDNEAPNGDSGSGIGGYSTTMRANSGGDPDQNANVDGALNSEMHPGLADGTHYFRIATTDRAGNWSSAPYSVEYGPIKIDATGPDSSGMNLSVTSGQTSGVWYTDNDISFSWLPAIDATSGLLGYSTDQDIGTVEIAAGATAHTETFADGSNVLFGLIPIDNLGNGGDVAGPLGPFWIDTTPPTTVVGVTAPQANVEEWTNQVNFTFTASDPATDATSGIAGYDTNDDDIVDNDLDRTFAEGTNHFFTIKALDNAGNVGANATFGPYWVDTTNPSVATNLTGDRPTSTWTNNPLVHFTWTPATDALSGIQGYDHNSDGILDIAGAANSFGMSFPDGNDIEFALAAADIAGNFGAVAGPIGPFWIDTVPPNAATNLNSSQNTNTWTNDSNFTFTWSPGNDATSGLAGYDSTGDRSMDLGDVTTETLTYPDSDGINFSLTPFDIAGNTGAAATLGPFLIDTVLPTGITSFSSSQIADEWTNDPNFVFGWIPATDDRSGIAGYDINEDGVSDLGGWETSREIAFPEGAANHFSIAALDNAGNIEPGQSFGSFMVDLTNPNAATNLVADAPTGVWSNNANVTFDWSPASDALSGLSGYDFTGDGEINLDGTATSYMMTFEEGMNHQFGLYAYDNAGNRSPLTGPIGDFWIDTTQPSAVTNLSASQAIQTWTNDDSFTFTFNAANDALSGVAGYDTDGDGIVDDLFTQTFPEGTGNLFSIRAIDNADNLGDAATLGNFWVDITAPTPAGNLAGDQSTSVWSNNPTVNFSWTPASDMLSGLDGYESSAGPLAAAATGTPHTFMGDGASHSFDLTALDAAGNQSSTETIGPFWIDNTPPESASDLTSDQAPNVWTNDPDFLFTWTAATDATSGIAGYDSTGDGLMDLGDVTTTLRSYADSDGDTFALTPFDFAGNMGPPIALGEFMVDTVLPNGITDFTSSQNADEWTKNPAFTFTWTSATDDRSGLAGYDLNGDGTGNIGAAATSRETVFSEGDSNTFQIAAIDLAGNIEAGQVFGPFKVDQTKPISATNLVANIPTETWSNDPHVDFTWTAATDALSGLNGYDTTGDGSVDLDGALTSMALLFTDGLDNQFGLYAYDHAGNRSTLTGPLGDFWIDTVSPTTDSFTSSSHTESVWNSSNTINFSWTASDATSGIAEYFLNGASVGMSGSEAITLPDGQFVNEIYSVDQAGNLSNTQSFTAWLDSSLPTIDHFVSSSHADSVWTNNGTLDLAWLGSDAISGVAEYFLNGASVGLDLSSVLNFADGQFLNEIYAVDNAGNASSIMGFTAWIDTTAPTLDSLTSSSHTDSVWSADGTLNLAWSGSDDTSGVMEYFLNGASVGLDLADALSPGDGKTTHTVYATDAAGLPSDNLTFTVWIDTTNPTIDSFTSATHTEGLWTSLDSVELSWSAHDAGSEIAHYELNGIDVGLDTTATIALAEGVHDMTLIAYDAVGNASLAASYEVKIDTLAPSMDSLTSSSHTDSVWGANGTLTLAWTASDSGSGITDFVLNGTSVGFNNYAELTPGDGAISHSVYAIDAAGNLSTEMQFQSWIDTTAPIAATDLNGDLAPSTWTNNPIVNFTWTAAQDPSSGLAGYDLTGNGGLNTGPDTTSWARNFQEGDDKMFGLYAHDNLGHISELTGPAGPYWIDTTPPSSVSNLRPDQAPFVWTNDNTVTFTFDAATDALSGVAGYDTNADGVIDNNPTATFADGQNNSFSIQAIDQATNIGDAASLGDFWIDTVAPTGTIYITPSPFSSGADFTLNPKVELNFTSNDDRSGVTHLRLSNDGITWTFWTPVTQNIPSWDFTDPNYGGTSTPNTHHTVWAKFRDAANNEHITTDQIYYLTPQQR